MLAYIIPVTGMMHNHPVHFQHVSWHRFASEAKCMAAGRSAVRAAVAQMGRYHKKPPVKIMLDCDEQVTFES